MARRSVRYCIFPLEPLTRVLKQLAGDGDPSPLAPGDAREKTTSNDTVGHVGEAELSHDRRHLRGSQRSKVRGRIPPQLFSLDAAASFFRPRGVDEEETPGRHLLPDGFGRVLLQGQLGRVGQSLLHRQITQQVVALEAEHVVSR